MEALQTMKFVKGLAPAADRWNTNPATDRVNMAEWDKAVFIVHQQGGTTGKATLTLRAHVANSGGTPEALAFSYRKGADGAGAGGDAIGALTQATTAGFDTTPAEDALYFIEIRADQLPDGKKYIDLLCTEAVNDPINGVVEIMLYKGRHSGDDLNTVL